VSKLKQHHHWRWANLAAAIALLALGLILLGNHVTAAQGPSSLAALEEDPYDLRVGKGNFPGNAKPGGVFVYGIYYGNVEAPGTANDVTIVDTLPPGTTYLGDTSGFAVGYDEIAGTVTWHVGTLESGQEGLFAVTLGMPPDMPDPPQIEPNHVSIAPTGNDLDTSNNEASPPEPVNVVPPVDIDLDVGKGPEPGDPMTGEEFQYSVNWCNTSELAVGPVTLIDTLPEGVHYVDWYHAQPWERLWNLVSADDSEVVLEAPGVPGNWCQQLYIVLRVDELTEIGTTLTNTVEIHVAEDENLENNFHVNTDAQVSPPRADMFVEKGFNGGILVPDGQIEYGGRYWNQGNVAVDAWLADTLPPGTSYRTGSGHFDGVQVEPIDPDAAVLEWDLGTVAVNQGADFTFIVDIVGGSPTDEFGNCIQISHDQTETTPWDNESCAEVTIFDFGPNLHVEKWSQWNREEIYYTFLAANVGSELASNVFITDTYPVGTTAAGDPGVPMHLQEKTTVSSPPGQWVFEITELQPGESGWFDFNVSVTDPEARPAEFINTIEIDSDPPAADVNPADNFYTDVIFVPEVERVNLWLEPDGQSNMWGEAQAGAVVTVTTPAHGIYTTTAEMDGWWGIEDTGIIEPGDSILVEAGEGLLPVTVEVPDPFTAELDRAAGTVSGEIGGWLDQPVEVRSWWDGGQQQLMTNELGEYEAVYDEIPPGAQGVTYFETMVNYTQIGYFRHFRDMSLLLQVNYDHDWIQGEYEVGHTVWLTVEKPAEFYTVTLTTDYGEWGDGGGFTSDWGEWHPERPNLEPGDLVFGEVDNGYEASLRIGTITGSVDADSDSIEGTVHAEWLPADEVNVECQPWGAEGEVPSKWSSAGTDGAPPYFCQWDPAVEWDVQPGQDIGVSYYEPEGHQVLAGFSTPWMRVNYGHDWVGGNYPLGHTFVVTVTESGGVTVKGTAVVETTPDGGWGGPGFETHEDNWIGAQPDIMPGDLVLFATDGYSHTVRVGTIEGTLSVSADSIGGPIYADWFTADLLDVECHLWGGPEYLQPKSSTAGPDGDPEYLCDWSGEWDIVPGQDIGVMYIEPDDADRVINAFREPAPDMNVGKRSQGSEQFEPGGLAVFEINWSNDGDGAATSVTMTDTLPSGVTYVADTSGFTHDYDPTEGTVVWEFGSLVDPVERGDSGQFQLVVEIPPDPEPELINMVDIFAEFDPNEEDNHAEATIHLAAKPAVELYVNKNPMPGDPTPGSTYVYEIEYGNNGNVPSGQATLTDILPHIEGVCSTTVVDWYSQNGYDLWTDISLGYSELVLSAPTLPGGWGDRIVLRLRVDELCPLETQLVNEVRLAAPPADLVSQVNENAWTAGPYTNAHLEKGFGSGMLVPGGEIGYSLQVANHGNMTATITLTDTLPTGTTFGESWAWDGREYVPFAPTHIGVDDVSWSVGEMPPGSWLNIDLRLDIDLALEYDTTLTNCAEIVVAEGDAWPRDNVACHTEVVREPGPNLRVYKDYYWNWEGSIHYEIHFQNVGTLALHDVHILDDLPPGTTFDGVSWGSDFWHDIYYDPLGLTPRWIIPVLEPGWSSRIWFDVELDGELVGDEGLGYTNLVEAPVPDDVWPDDNISEITAYTGPDIFVEKWLSGGEPRPGEIVTFTVVFGNQNQPPWGSDPGVEPATTFAETLPDDLTFLTATDPWNPDEEWLPGDIVGNTYYWDFGPMDAGSSWTVEIVALVSEEAVEGNVIVNTVEAWSNGDDIDPLLGNNTYDLELTILPGDYYVYLPIILRNH